jgi:DNA mismatch endonuclease (patch repair protein)
VFVHGCFWHVHDGCKFATRPSSRKEFWKEKFAANRKRDRRNYAALAADGWRVLVVWECAIKGRKEDELDGLGKAVEYWLTSDECYGEIEGIDGVSMKKKSKKRGTER